MDKNLHQAAGVKHGDDVGNNLQLILGNLIPLLESGDEFFANTLAGHGFNIVEGFEADIMVVESTMRLKEAINRGANAFIFLKCGVRV